MERDRQRPVAANLTERRDRGADVAGRRRSETALIRIDRRGSVERIGAELPRRSAWPRRNPNLDAVNAAVAKLRDEVGFEAPAIDADLGSRSRASVARRAALHADVVGRAAE